LPEKWVHVGAGILFLAFAAYTWFFHDKDEAEEEKEVDKQSYKAAFLLSMWRSFVVIFIAEWGDVTQPVTASLAARYHDHPVLVFTSATSALWLVNALAMWCMWRC
jgi:putative Ca2+/H+ antiporter (TMEM165/GDT1 family)